MSTHIYLAACILFLVGAVVCFGEGKVHAGVVGAMIAVLNGTVLLWK